jgi:hypothetical protein
VRLLHADLAGALALNPLAACAAAAFLAGGVVAPVWIACGGPALRVASRPRPAWIAAFAVAFLANWAWLFASGV